MADWLRCIKRALDSAATVVVVWTPRSVGSDNAYTSEMVAVEANEGWQNNKLIPVRMDHGRFAFPHGLRQAEDLTEWLGNTDDPAFSRLAAAISGLCGEPDAPDPTELAAWLEAEDANNADQYRQFARNFPGSRFASEAEPRAAEIEQYVADIGMAKDAAARIIDQFAQEVGKPTFAPAIAFEKIERERALEFSAKELFEGLVNGSRAVLQATPGGGKTVALLEWAAAYNASDPERVGVFLRLKEIAKTGDDLIEHVARLESTEHVSERAWLALTSSGVLTLFCDGWNELSERERELVGTKLNIFARNYPSAGLIIGTRPLVPEPLAGPHLLLTLQRLTFEQVRAIVEDKLGEGANAAITELRQSRELADLVRTPFFLSAFCETRLAGSGSAPTTREGLMRGMIEASENLAQHAGPLRQALEGQQGKYLRALAVDMVTGQEFELSNDNARSAVNREANRLLETGVINQLPNTSRVLETLRDHHCLIEHTGAAPTFRFQHQLINEWYAAEEVRSVALLALRSHDARRRLDETILDDTAWTEAIVFAVERPPDSEDGVRATAHLILRTIGIDPEFAADLISVAPQPIWEEIAPIVRSFIEELRLTAKRRAVRFALLCGKEDHSEILWQAISEERSGNPAYAFDVSEIAHPGVLGADWKAKCAALNTEGRKSLLTMIASGGSLEGAAMAVEAAKTDQEPGVQEAVAGMLDFYEFREELAELLEAAHPETWEELVSRRTIDDLWNERWRLSAIAAVRRIFEQTDPGPKKIDYALRLKALGQNVDTDLVAELLGIQTTDYHVLDSLYARVAETEGERLSAALIERSMAGQRLVYDAGRYIRKDTPVSQDRLLEACRIKTNHRHHLILAPLLNVESLTTLFGELIEAHARYRTATGRDKTAAGEHYQTLRDALTYADKNALAEMSQELDVSTSDKIAEASYIIMRAYRSDIGRDEREPLRANLRGQLVELLARWSEQLIADSACSRHALHSLAEAIATFPSNSLLTPLRNLLLEDIVRWRAEKEEFKARIERGQRPDPASGARMSYANRYGQNMLSLATGDNPDIARDDRDEARPTVSPEMTDAVIDILSGLIMDPEFGDEAARVIATLRPDPVMEIRSSRRYGSHDFSVIKERKTARQRRGAETVHPDAQRLLDAIDELRSKGTSEALRHAVKLSRAAVRMAFGPNQAGLTQLVVEHGSIEDVADHLMISLLLGYNIDGNIAETCLDRLDARRDEREWEYRESWYRWQDLLVLMIFGGKPVEAAHRLLTYDTRTRDHDERRIIEALGLCEYQGALIELELLRDRCVAQGITYEWVDAVGAVGTAEAGNVLIVLAATSQQRDLHHADQISQKIATLAKKHPSLRERLMGIARGEEGVDLGGVRRIFSKMDDEEFIMELIVLPGGRLQLFGQAIAGSLRDLCLEHQPVDGSSGPSTIVPHPVARLRARLFARVTARDSGSDICARLLAMIDEIRDDYGRPAEEARHPDIALGKAWPQAAQRAWDASIDIRLNDR